MRMVTLHWGTLWQVQLLQGQLADVGIWSTIPDLETRVMYPWYATGFALYHYLTVAEVDSDVAHSIVSEVNARGPAEEVFGADEPPSEGERSDEALLALGTRAKWASLHLFLWPVALVLGWRYFTKASQQDKRPHDYVIVAAALYLCAFQAATLATFVVAFGGRISILGHGWERWH